MALSKTELLNEAKKLEVQGSEKYKINPICVSKLDTLLNQVYATRRPKPIDYHNRRDLIRILNAIAKELYGNSENSPIVEGFGSFVMDMFSVGSDLDLSVNFGDIVGDLPRHLKIKTLRKFAKKFYSLQRGGHVVGLQTIMSARVPIIKFIDSGTGIECDLSVENRDGIQKSQILHIVSEIDERFQKLSFLMKTWAKAHNINSAKDRTLSSLSIIQLVAFHLQTRVPPILPPFSSLFADGTDPVIVVKRVRSYLEFGKSNKESLVDLFISLLVKVASVENLWQKCLTTSLYEGSWTSKLWDSQYNFINVEDFTDPSQNVARAVGREEFKEIYRCIHSSLSHLLAFSDDQIHDSMLVDLLFGTHSVSFPTQFDTTSNGEAKLSLPVDGHQTKRMRISNRGKEKEQEDGWRGKQLAQSWGPAHQVDDRDGRQQADGWGGRTQVDDLGGRQQHYGQALGVLNAPVVSYHTPQVVPVGSPQVSTLYNVTPTIPYQIPLVASNTGNNNACYGSPNLTAVATSPILGHDSSVACLLQSAFVSQQSFLGFEGSHRG